MKRALGLLPEYAAGTCSFSDPPFVQSAAGFGDPRLLRNPAGDPVQPGADSQWSSDRVCTPGQDEECRLKSVFCIVGITQDSQAHVHDRWTVAHDQRLERGFRVVSPQKAFEKLDVRQLAQRSPDEQALKRAQ